MAVRLGRGIYGHERALNRAGLGPVAGADEAGRGACAGPLVAAAVILDDRPGRRIEGLRDSKLMTARARERAFAEIQQKAIAVAVVAVSPAECDRLGMHVADIQGLRRALMRLIPEPEFVLTDGFPVDGLPTPGLAMWKGDQVAACVAAASIIAKVTRDEIMTTAQEQYPAFNFSAHKGYCTAAHQRELEEHGPTEIHRWCFDNVVRAAKVEPR